MYIYIIILYVVVSATFLPVLDCRNLHAHASANRLRVVDAYRA